MYIQYEFSNSSVQEKKTKTTEQGYLVGRGLLFHFFQFYLDLDLSLHSEISQDTPIPFCWCCSILVTETYIYWSKVLHLKHLSHPIFPQYLLLQSFGFSWNNSQEVCALQWLSSLCLWLSDQRKGTLIPVLTSVKAHFEQSGRVLAGENDSTTKEQWLEHALGKSKKELIPLGRQLLLHDQAYLSYFLKAAALLMQTSIFFSHLREDFLPYINFHIINANFSKNRAKSMFRAP